MAKQSRPEPGSMAAGVFGRLALIAADWQDLDAQPGVVDEPIFTVAGPLLDLIGAHAPTSELSELRAAASDADPRALTMLVRLVALAREAIKQWHPVAQQLWRSGEFVEMLESAGPIADLAEAAADVDGILVCRIYQARACYRLGLVAEAEAAYRRALADAELLPAPDAKQLALCHDNLGLLLARDARDDEALGHFDRALELDPSMPTVVSTRENKAGTLQSLGRYAQAADLHQLNLTALEHSAEHDYLLPVVLDNLAQLRLATGEDKVALSLLERAAAAFGPDDLEARAVNLWIQARANRNLDRLSATAIAFAAAHDLLVSLTHTELGAEHFRAGFEQARGARTPASSQAWIGWGLGQEASRRGEWTQAQLVFAKARDYATHEGDVELSLRCDANVAAALADARDIDGSFALCTNVYDLAVRFGYAVPAMMVSATQASLVDSGSDRGEQRGALGLWIRARALVELHRAMCIEAGVDPGDPSTSVADLGQIDRGLGRLASEFHANELAGEYFRSGIEKAAGYRFGRINGLAGLLNVLTRDRSTHDAEIAAVAAELTALLTDQSLSPREQLAGHWALSNQLAEADIHAAIEHLRSAAIQLEILRAALPPGPDRANLDAEYRIYPTLRRALQSSGDDAAAFEALQFTRARRLAESLTAATGDSRPYQPPDLAEAQRLVAQVRPMAALVDITAEPGTGVVEGREVGGVRVNIVTAVSFQSFPVVEPAAVLAEAWHAMGGDVRQRAADAVRLVTESPLFAHIAEQLITRLAPGTSVLLSVDDELANLPLHIAPVGGHALCEVLPICRLPAIGVLRFSGQSRPWAGRSLVAGDSRKDLPGAAAECRQVAEEIGTEPLIGDLCTLDAIRERLLGADLDVVHLAVHGRGDVRRGGRASLLFADGAGATRWVSLGELAALSLNCRVIVLSGCSTAVGGPRNGTGLYGVAQAAAEAGATSVIASLWPVRDRAAALFMSAFYDELTRLRSGSGDAIDLRLLVEHARSALRRGSSTPSRRRDGDVPDTSLSRADGPDAAALDWAAFVVLGNPMLSIA